MELFPQIKKKEIYDPIRHKWVVAYPEEIIRQKLISFLVEELFFPIASIAVEKQLSELLPKHLKRTKRVRRRMDLLCYEERFFNPLLLIECKATSLNRKMLLQILGYNTYLKAPFIALVNENEQLLGWKKQNQLQIINRIPSYLELLEMI